MKRRLKILLFGMIIAALLPLFSFCKQENQTKNNPESVWKQIKMESMIQ